MLVSEISEFELINRIQEIVSPQNESSRQPIKNLGHDLILSIGAFWFSLLEDNVVKISESKIFWKK